MIQILSLGFGAFKVGPELGVCQLRALLATLHSLNVQLYLVLNHAGRLPYNIFLGYSLKHAHAVFS